jgi:serine/threonine-protein kinase
VTLAAGLQVQLGRHSLTVKTITSTPTEPVEVAAVDDAAPAVTRVLPTTELLPTMTDFELLEAVHKGETGTFYKARWSAKDDRELAVKLVKPSLTRDEEAMYKFCRGVSAAGAIRHPHILRLYRAGKNQGRWFVAMEWMAKGSLADMIGRGRSRTPLPPGFVRRVGVEMCRALEVVAENNVIHRKVTPGSILFDDKGVAKLGDFVMAREEVQDPTHQMTLEGQVIGDPRYMSPEQLQGAVELDARTDVYGLAASLYEALTGQTPRGNGNLIEQVKRSEQPPASARSLNANVSSNFDKVLQKALSPNRDDRFESASAFRDSLELVSL